MSLRHLYIDLNSLGVYPDLLYIRSGDISLSKIIVNNNVITYDNKYYGYRSIMLCTDVYISLRRVMYMNGDVKLHILYNLKDSRGKFIFGDESCYFYITKIGNKIVYTIGDVEITSFWKYPVDMFIYILENQDRIKNSKDIIHLARNYINLR